MVTGKLTWEHLHSTATIYFNTAKMDQKEKCSSRQLFSEYSNTQVAFNIKTDHLNSKKRKHIIWNAIYTV